MCDKLACKNMRKEEDTTLFKSSKDNKIKW